MRWLSCVLFFTIAACGSGEPSDPYETPVTWDRLSRSDAIGGTIYECDDGCRSPTLMVAKRLSSPEALVSPLQDRSVAQFFGEPGDRVPSVRLAGNRTAPGGFAQVHEISYPGTGVRSLVLSRTRSGRFTRIYLISRSSGDLNRARQVIWPGLLSE